MLFWLFVFIFVIGLVVISGIFLLVFKKDDDVRKFESFNRGSVLKRRVDLDFERLTKK